MTNFGPGVQRLECGCSLIDGRCDKHAAMMREIHAVWQDGPADMVFLLFSMQDGYGEAGYVPEQGFDWSGVRDSSIEAIEAMWKAVHA